MIALLTFAVVLAVSTTAFVRLPVGGYVICSVIIKHLILIYSQSKARFHGGTEMALRQAGYHISNITWTGQVEEGKPNITVSGSSLQDIEKQIAANHVPNFRWHMAPGARDLPGRRETKRGLSYHGGGLVCTRDFPWGT